MNTSKPPIGQFGVMIALVGVLIIGARWFGSKTSSTTPTSVTPSATASSDAETNKKEQMHMTIHTDKGDIKLELFPDAAPKTVDNFKRLSAKNYYNSVIFHRVIKDFMIQTGDPTGTGSGGESADGGEFADEINNHKIEVGTVAMANRGPNTNGSQFFIVTEEAQPHLDGRHTVFGKVIEGMDVVRSIAAVPVNNPEENRPVQDVKITSITEDK